MTSISKNVYIDKLDDIVNEYNNTYHRTIKMKPVDVKDNTYINLMDMSRSNDKDPKFKVGDHVRIFKYKNIFTEGYAPNWSEEELCWLELMFLVGPSMPDRSKGRSQTNIVREEVTGSRVMVKDTGR